MPDSTIAIAMIEKFRWKDVKAEAVTMEGASGVKVRYLINELRGAKNFAMRVFELAKGGHTPYHQHDFEHEVSVLQGKGILKTKDDDRTLEPGDIAWVPPNDMHQFRNAGDEPFFFMCLVPITKK